MHTPTIPDDLKAAQVQLDALDRRARQFARVLHNARHMRAAFSDDPAVRAAAAAAPAVQRMAESLKGTYAASDALRDYVRGLRRHYGLCTRCGWNESRWGGICTDCRDDMAS